jgi:hypothetical protein
MSRIFLEMFKPNALASFPKNRYFTSLRSLTYGPGSERTACVRYDSNFAIVPFFTSPSLQNSVWAAGWRESN